MIAKTVDCLFGSRSSASIAAPVRGVEVNGAGRGRWGVKGKHGRPVALHAHLSALVDEAAREIVCAPFLVARVTDALDLEGFSESISCGCAGRRSVDVG